MSDGASTPVCGSDGVTYSSQCQVISKQCQGMSILIKHTGPCPGRLIHSSRDSASNSYCTDGCAIPRSEPQNPDNGSRDVSTSISVHDQIRVPDTQ